MRRLRTYPTDRELEVLATVARTGSVRAAAASLRVSPDAVKRMLHSTRRVLGARSTTHAVALIWRDLDERIGLMPLTDGSWSVPAENLENLRRASRTPLVPRRRG